MPKSSTFTRSPWGVSAEEDVARLDVAVHHVELVRAGERRGHGERDVDGLEGREGLALQARLEVSPSRSSITR
jgi:hypothetical protein